MRGEWIEIGRRQRKHPQLTRLAPCGASGLKYDCVVWLIEAVKSRPVRGEWIEILYPMPRPNVAAKRLAPCGASGLKLRLLMQNLIRAIRSRPVRGEWIEIHGVTGCLAREHVASRPVRGEWIEIVWKWERQHHSHGLAPCGASGLKLL